MKPAFVPVRSLLAVALAMAALPVAAQTFSQTVFFGDSLTDSGSFRPGLIQVAGPQAAVLGRFTTNPDLIWAEYLADYYGTQAVASNQGGTNYAVGGARNGVDGVSPFGPIPSVLNQVNTYLAASGGVADANALYTVWGGANDLFAVVDGAPAEATLTAAVTAQVGAINTLKTAGARYVLVPTIPDLGITPAFRAQGAAAMAGGTQLAVAYNTALFGALSRFGLQVIPLDTFSLLSEIVADPGTYGFSNVTGTACQPQITASSLTCSPATLINPNAPDTYIFADGVHPTGAAHEIVADAALSVLEGPRQIAVLPHSAAVVGRGRAERVAAHLAAPTGQDGMNWWANVRGDFQRYDHGDHYDGAGPSLTVGVDWTSGKIVYGGFFGYGRQALDWGLRRGSFDQTDTTIGGFAGWRGESLWVNGQVSYSRIGFDIDRNVQLGPATRTYAGSPDGGNFSTGISGGWNFGDGALRHGPVVSLLSQHIEIDGYSEDRVDSTALAYPEQSFDSMIGSVGWQASYAINDHLKPYARVTMDREFEDAPDEAFARSLSVAGSGTYAVPGLEFDRDYATIVFGARTRVFGLDANIGASATVNQDGGNDAGVFVTFGSGF